MFPSIFRGTQGKSKELEASFSSSHHSGAGPFTKTSETPMGCYADTSPRAPSSLGCCKGKISVFRVDDTKQPTILRLNTSESEAKLPEGDYGLRRNLNHLLGPLSGLALPTAIKSLFRFSVELVITRGDSAKVP